MLNKYKKAVSKDRPVKKISRSPLRQGKPSSPRGESSKRRGDVTTKFPPQSLYINMSRVSSASNSFCPTWGHEGVWMQCYPMPHPSSHQSGGYFRTLFDRFSRPVHDRLGPRQSGQQQHAAPVRPVQPDRSDRSQQRRARSHPPKQEYRIKKEEGEAQPCRLILGRL